MKGCFLVVCRKENLWYFALDSTQDLPQEPLSSLSLDSWACANHFKRHTAYDGVFYPRTLLVRPFLFESHSLIEALLLPSGKQVELAWFTFPQMLKTLQSDMPGGRNFLQLAVQYLAAGATIDQSVIAAPEE